jgi:hypothetical protein
MIARRRVGCSRRGSLLAEMAMSAVMLMIAMSLIARVVGWTAAERRSLDRRQWAVQEGANLMERLSARPFESLTTDAVKNTALSPEAVRTLPDAQLHIEVSDHDPTGGDDSKRIALGLRWRSRSGEWDAPVRLTTWVYRRKGGSR